MEKNDQEIATFSFPEVGMISKIVEDPVVQASFFEFERHMDLFGTELSKEQYLEHVLEYGKRELQKSKCYENGFASFFRKYSPFLEEYVSDDLTKWYRNSIAEDCSAYFSVSPEYAVEYINVDTACLFPWIASEVSEQKIGNELSSVREMLRQSENVSKEYLEQAIVLACDYDATASWTLEERASFYEDIFHHLLETKDRIKDVHYQKFIGSYLLNVTKAYDLPTVLFYDSTLEEKGSYIFNEETQVHEISLSTSWFTHQNILANLETVFHEVSHALDQNNLTHIYNYNLHRRVKDEVLEEKLGRAFYDHNYFDISYEGEAKYRANVHLLSFLNRVSPKIYSAYYDSLIEQIKVGCMARNVAERVDCNGETRHLDLLFEKSFSKEEIVQLQKDPQIGPILQLEYDELGTRKSIYEFVRQRCSFEQENNIGTTEAEKESYYERLNFYNAMVHRSGYTPMLLALNFRKIIFTSWENMMITKEMMNLIPFFERKIGESPDVSGVYSPPFVERNREHLYKEREGILAMAGQDTTKYLTQEKIWSKKYSFYDRVHAAFDKNIQRHKIISLPLFEPVEVEKVAEGHHK